MQLGYKITNENTRLTKIVAFSDYAVKELMQIMVFYRRVGFRVEIEILKGDKKCM